MDNKIQTPTHFIKSFFTFDKKSIRVILSLILPVFAELLLSTSFGMADHIMASRYDTDALIAITLYSAPANIFNILFTAINVGTTVRVAWNIGANNYEAARRVLRTSLILNFILGIIITTVSVLSAPYVVQFMAGDKYGSVYTPGTIAYEAVQVYIICSFFTLASGLKCSITAALRGAGENKAPLVYNLTSSFLNVIGNYLLIYGVPALAIPEMGARGAALSTTITYYIGFIFAVIYILNSKKSKLGGKNPDYLSRKSQEKQSVSSFIFPNIIISRNILRIGVPSALENLIISIGSVLFSKMIISTGPDNYAAYQISNSAYALFAIFTSAFSIAANTLIGQNVGAKDIKGAKNYVNTISRFSFLISLCLSGAIILLSKQLILLYTDKQNIIPIAKILISISAITIISQNLSACFAGSLRGAGDTKFPLYTSIGCVLILRVVITALVVYVFKLGIYGIQFVILSDQTIQAITMYIRYRSGRWEKYSKETEKD